MVTVPTLAVSKLVIQRSPIKPLLIGGYMVVESVIFGSLVASTAPNCLTGLPGWPGGGKVGAEDTGHPPFGHATQFAPPDPEPEGEGFA